MNQTVLCDTTMLSVGNQIVYAFGGAFIFFIFALLAVTCCMCIEKVRDHVHNICFRLLRIERQLNDMKMSV